MLQYNHSLVVLRRDLRLQDNSALHAALRQSSVVSVAFVLDDKQIQPHAWRSDKGLTFMLSVLVEMHQELGSLKSGLILLEGEPSAAIATYAMQHSIDAIFINHDYTPFARNRDKKINQSCETLGLPCHWFHDALLNPPNTIKNGSGQPYKIFSAFFRACAKHAVSIPQTYELHGKFIPMPANDWQRQLQKITAHQDPEAKVYMGRNEAISLLESLNEQNNYIETRDIPALDATTHLSVHLKFGTVSVREVYAFIFQILGQDHALLRQLFWRDFFYHLVYHLPHVFGHSFLPQFEHLAWQNDDAKFKAWCEGNTGFPIVDAGMRELAETGYMHNRVRMITASFLVKDLHVDWRWGEAWFARHLLDYDPAINNGNWQWAASTGCDAQPWFRIFNPWRQQQRFDPKGEYIRRYLPRLSEVSDKQLLQWHTFGDAALHPLPIIDHAVESKVCKAMYQQAHQQFQGK